MAGITDMVNVFDDFCNEIIREAWLPRIYDVAFDPKRPEFWSRIPRTSEGIKSLKVYIPFIKRKPWAWRGMTAQGFTPSGNTLDVANMYFKLACSAAAAAVSDEELQATRLAASEMQNLLDQQMTWLMETFPYYLRAQVWTPDQALKALGKVASVSSSVVTLDNAGLWATSTKDRAKLFEISMVLQPYRGTAKQGQPVYVTDVDHVNGTVTLDRDVESQLADNDVLVCSDIGGLDTPYLTEFPGIFDVIDDDNTFQGVARDEAGTGWAHAIVQSASGETMDYDFLSTFFHRCFSPRKAYTHPDVVRAYFKNNIQPNVRFQPGGTYEDGVQYVDIDNTRLYGLDDCHRDKLFIPDAAGSLRIAELGGVYNLFDKGWQQISGRPLIEYVVAWWGRLVANDCRKMALLTDLSY